MDGTTTIKIDCYEELKANSDKWIEKETPFKPIKQIYYSEEGIRFGLCKCGQNVYSDCNYCDNCGRRMDWSNV